jgi:hypothetical protein
VNSFFDITYRIDSAGGQGDSGENKLNSFFDIFIESSTHSRKRPVSGPSSFFDVYLEMAQKDPAKGENKTNSFFDIFTEIDTNSIDKGPDCRKEANDNLNQAKFEAFNTYTKMINDALYDRWSAERSANELTDGFARINALNKAEIQYSTAERNAKSSLDSANSFIATQEAKLENHCK